MCSGGLEKKKGVRHLGASCKQNLDEKRTSNGKSGKAKRVMEQDHWGKADASSTVPVGNGRPTVLAWELTNTL